MVKWGATAKLLRYESRGTAAQRPETSVHGILSVSRAPRWTVPLASLGLIGMVGQLRAGMAVTAVAAAAADVTEERARLLVCTGRVERGCAYTPHSHRNLAQGRGMDTKHKTGGTTLPVAAGCPVSAAPLMVT